MKLAITNSFNSARDMFFWNKCKTYNKNHQNQEFPRRNSGSLCIYDPRSLSPVPAVFLGACLPIHRSQKNARHSSKEDPKKSSPLMAKPTWNHNISSYVHIYIYICMYIYVYIYVCVPFKSNKLLLEKCHLVRQLPSILHGRRHGPSTKTDLDEKSHQWYPYPLVI